MQIEVSVDLIEVIEQADDQDQKEAFEYLADDMKYLCAYELSDIVKMSDKEDSSLKEIIEAFGLDALDFGEVVEAFGFEREEITSWLS